MLSPEQSRPPYSGEGLEQLRNRLFCPYPQVVLQEPQSLQLVHPPSTATIHCHWSCAISIQQNYEPITQMILILCTVLAKENVSFFQFAFYFVSHSSSFIPFFSYAFGN